MPDPLLAAIISAAVSAVVTGVINWNSLRAQRRQHVENMIAKMIDIAITYPYLEDDAFCARWNDKTKSSEEGQRYENYCCFVFNLLETVWKLHGGKGSDIERTLYVPEIAARHAAWWNSQRLNVAGYDTGFVAYINAYTKKGTAHGTEASRDSR
jgi:hypothetical protein